MLSFQQQHYVNDVSHPANLLKKQDSGNFSWILHYQFFVVNLQSRALRDEFFRQCRFAN